MSPRPSRVRWLLIFWMFVISAIAFLDRVNIGVAGTSMERAFGFDTSNLGSLPVHSTGDMRFSRPPEDGWQIDSDRVGS